MIIWKKNHWEDCGKLRSKKYKDYLKVLQGIQVWSCMLCDEDLFYAGPCCFMSWDEWFYVSAAMTCESMFYLKDAMISGVSQFSLHLTWNVLLMSA